MHPPPLESDAPPTDSTPGADPIGRCACGVPLGRAHYCAARDHNWIKAPEPADDLTLEG